MISYIKGSLELKTIDYVVIDVGGIAVSYTHLWTKRRVTSVQVVRFKRKK